MLFTGTRRQATASTRRLGAAAAVAVLAVVAVALRSGGGEPMHPWAELAEDVRGTYAFDDDTQLTLWGSADHPSLEVAGQITTLAPAGQDRFDAMDGTTVSVERDSSGMVTGIVVEADGTPRRAVHNALHTEAPVRFSSDGATLTGTLFLPPGPGPHPAVALAHGAGPKRRQDYPWLYASHFARDGVAALVYDKRGIGESTGDYASATFDDLTGDLLAAVGVLADQPGVDPDRIGVVGFSQGAWIIAQAARANDDIAFVIANSASGFSPGDQQAWLHGSMLASRGFTERAMTVADRVDRMLYSSLDLVDAGLMPAIPHVPGFWFHALDLHLDSAALWEGVRQPVLAVWGELDCQVPAHDSAHVLADALHRGGNDDVTTVLLPGADHSFLLVEECGHETGMAHHGSMTYADGALDAAARWITTGELASSDIPASLDNPILGWHMPAPAPAPWYGTLVAQLAALLALLGAFGTGTMAWARRRNAHLVAAAAVSGLLATIVGFAAFAEVAMLGGTHSSFLVGGPTVQGSSVLSGAGRLLVPLTAVLTVAGAIRNRTATRRVRLVGAGVVLLVAWAAYWQLLPL